MVLSPADANKRFGIPNILSFDAPVFQHVAEEQYQRKRDDLFRQSAIDRREGGIATALWPAVLQGWSVGCLA